MTLCLLGRSPLEAPRRRHRSLAGRLWLLASLCLLPACSDVDDVCANESDCIYTAGWGESPACESLSLSECAGADDCSVESACRPHCSGPSCDASCDVVSRCISN
jgi:hypothetical protein